jgi:hypothetical protein
MVLLRKQSKQTVRDTLDHIQRWHAPDALNVRDLSPITQIYDLLKSRREEPPSRQFLRFKFTHNSARDLLLPEVLRNPEVYNAHPEPDTAAAIMVSTSFDPQLASRLLNYTQVAKTLDVAKATSDTLGDCSCRQCFTQLAPSDLSSLGHVCTYDTTNLRWPYLSSITKAGKKLRLLATIDSVTKELDAGIDHYLTWATEKYQGGEKHAKLSSWAENLRQLAILNWQQSQSRSPTSTDGYPGLRQAINEAQRHLVFLHDDRAPHGIYMACRRWYEKEMAVYLEDSSVFEAVHEDWDTISSKIKEKLNTFGFPMGPAIVYNYGIWKPKKGKFRYIAGSRKPDPPAEPDTPQRSPANASPAHPGPPRSPGYFLSKALVAALKHVMQSLRDNDDIRQRDTGLRCFWVFESVGEYARFVRTHATQIASSGLQTYDFTTMYTIFDQSTLVSNVMQAIAEAQHFEASKSPPNSQPPTLTTSGWDTTGIGWSLNDLQEMISFSVSIAYTTNGGITRRQRLGVPMGLPEAPQLVNLACYIVERDYVLTHKPSGLAGRYIDDFICSGMCPPPQSAYGMEYKATSSDPKDVVYLGVHTRILDNRLRTTLFDREQDYPFHIVRYPEYNTTAPQSQFGGVIFGRFCAAQDVCSHVQDLKESIGNIVRHAIWRAYPHSLVTSVWARFLHRKWPPGDIRKKEMITWFKRLLQHLRSTGVRAGAVNPRVPQPPIRPASPTQDHYQVYGRPSQQHGSPAPRRPPSPTASPRAQPATASPLPPPSSQGPPCNMDLENSVPTDAMAALRRTMERELQQDERRRAAALIDTTGISSLLAAAAEADTPTGPNQPFHANPNPTRLRSPSPGPTSIGPPPIPPHRTPERQRATTPPPGPRLPHKERASRPRDYIILEPSNSSPPSSPARTERQRPSSPTHMERYSPYPTRPPPQLTPDRCAPAASPPPQRSAPATPPPNPTPPPSSPQRPHSPTHASTLAQGEAPQL